MVDHEIVVVGAGFSGIGLGIQLKKAGFEDFRILDAAGGIGGVWYHNRYPGVAVDIPSTTYSYSFESNPSWSRLFAPGAELRQYAERCVDKYGLKPHIQLHTKVERAVFDEHDNVWYVHTDCGLIIARFLIGAVGPLDQPKNPDIKGINDFRGELVHTARWDDNVAIDGKRVAVIGTGATANTYLSTFNRDDVDLVTEPIVRVTENGIVTEEQDPQTGERRQTEHAVDTLVLATGFNILQLGAMPAFPVVGLGGVELGAFWDENRYQNFEGVSSPIAPNFWLMNGPWSVTGASWFSIIEAGCRHIVRCLEEARRRGATRMAVKQKPHDKYMRSMRKKAAHTVFVQPSCAQANSYYFDRHGDAPFVRPVSGVSLWLASKTFDLDSYEYTPGLRKRGNTRITVEQGV